MESSERVPTPIARTRLDRLFVTWLSKKSTQDCLMQELKRVLVNEDSGIGYVATPRQFTPSPSHDDARSSSPLTPPVGHSPRSSRRSKNSSLVSRTSRKSSNAKSVGVKTDLSGQPPSSLEIPPFYFPYGKPSGGTQLGLLKDIYKKFKSFPKGVATLDDFGTVVKVWFTCCLYMTVAYNSDML